MDDTYLGQVERLHQDRVEAVEFLSTTRETCDTPMNGRGGGGVA
jgi:hypothetical protein